MTQKNLAAYTAAGNDSPEYLSVNRHDNGDIWVTMRDKPYCGEQRTTAIRMSEEDLKMFALSLLVATGAVGGPLDPKVYGNLPAPRSGEDFETISIDSPLDLPITPASGPISKDTSFDWDHHATDLAAGV